VEVLVVNMQPQEPQLMMETQVQILAVDQVVEVVVETKLV